MKKFNLPKANLSKLALMGIASGALLAVTSCNESTKELANTERNSHIKLNENTLVAQLNERGLQEYNSLDREGKTLALKLANQDCKGQNDCKGLNSCKTKENSCAGQGSCKGKSPGPFTDKNKAVHVAFMKMAEKRKNMSSY